MLERIGEGGMGTVYLAEQTHPVRRAVALQVLKPGMDSRQVVARFEAERQALAIMDHPNIAKVLDAGTTEGGRAGCRAERNRRVVARLEETILEAGDNPDFRGIPAAFSEAFRKYGLPVESLDPAAAAERVAASGIKDQLVDALQEWAWRLGHGATRSHPVAVTRLADPGEWRDRLRDLSQERDLQAIRQPLLQLAGRPEVEHWPPRTLTHLGAGLARVGAVPEAVRLSEQAQRLHPADFWVNLLLAEFLTGLTPPQRERATGYFRAALALRPQSAAVRVMLGRNLRLLGQLDEAAVCYHEALRRQPDLAKARIGLGAISEKRGRLTDAIAAYREAIRLRPDYAMAHNNLGNALRRQGRPEEALAAYRTTLAIQEKRLKDHPEEHRVRYELALTLHALSFILMGRDELAEAREFARRAVRHRQEAVKLFPRQPVQRRSLREYSRNLAECLVRLGGHAEAARVAAELPGIVAGGWEGHVRAAEFLARCVPLAEADAGLAADRRGEVAGRYAGQAVDLLRQAVAKGYRNGNELKANPHLKPLHGREDFRKLLAELGPEGRQP